MLKESDPSGINPSFHSAFEHPKAPSIFSTSQLDQSFSFELQEGCTLLSYNSQAEDVKWEVSNEAGFYTFTAKDETDGLVIIPPEFYIEFSLELHDRLINLAGTFDGTGVAAIALAFNSVQPSDFLEVLTNRLNVTLTSVLKPMGHTITTIPGTSMAIPQAAKADLGFKLATIGISLISARVLSEIDLPNEEGVPIREIYDELPSKDYPVMRKSAPVPKLPTTELKDKTSPATDSNSLPPSPTTSQPQTAGSPSPKPMSASAAHPPSPRKVPESEPEQAMPPSPKTRGLSHSKPSIPPGPGKVKAKKMLPVEVEKVEDEKYEEVSLLMDDDEELDEMLPTSMSQEARDVEPLTRHTHTSWFDRMLPNRSYPLVIKITAEVIQKRDSATLIISGERATEHVEIVEIKDTRAPIIIRPQFPGCLVTPREASVEVSSDVVAEFYITPLTLGTIDSKVAFLQHDNIFHKLELSTKVITNRLSRVMGILGILGSITPGIFAFIAGEDPQNWLNDRFDIFFPILAGLGYLPILLSGVVLAGSGWLFSWIRRPKPNQTTLVFPR